MRKLKDGAMFVEGCSKFKLTENNGIQLIHICDTKGDVVAIPVDSLLSILEQLDIIPSSKNDMSEYRSNNDYATTREQMFDTIIEKFTFTKYTREH